MQLLKHFFFYDALHKRIDLHRYLTYAVIAGVAFVWSLLGNPTFKQYVSRLIISAVFMGLVRVCFVRLSASRLSSLIMTVTAFLLVAGLRPRALVEVGMFAGFLLICLEFCKLRTKFAALGAGVAVGLLAAGAGPTAKAMMVLFVLFLTSRLIWHVGIERISKIELILFTVKIIAAGGIATALYYGLRNQFDFPWAEIGYLAVPHISWWILAPLILLTVRGLWGTLLLETERSPKGRGIRMYLAFIGLVMFGVSALVQYGGTDIFAAPFLQHLAAAGLADDYIQTHIFGMYAVLLFAAEGIDRSLYRDAIAGRVVGRAVMPKHASRS